MTSPDNRQNAPSASLGNAYGGVSGRGSRIAYSIGRALRLLKPGKNMFWDTQVPHEHTFETTLAVWRPRA